MDSERHCDNDIDCGPNYYCYKISKLCVNFTNCLQYNRIEGTAPARSATRCGPCMTGYTTEILADGTESPLCQKNIIDINQNSMSQTTMIWTITSVFFLILIIALIYYFIKYFRRKRFNCFMRNNAANVDVATTTNIDELITASAPLEEQSPFIEIAEDKYRVHNNNNRTINNEYQTTRCNVLPQWGYISHHRCTPTSNANRTVRHFDNNVPDAAVPNEENILALLQNNIPDQSTVQLTITGLPEVNIEQEDNARNTTLLQTHQTETSSNNDTNSSPETNKKDKAKKKNNVIINQSVNQNINMNVNVFNENE